jgi:hypothetical protein
MVDEERILTPPDNDTAGIDNMETPPVTNIGQDERVVIPPDVEELTVMAHMDKIDTPPVTNPGVAVFKRLTVPAVNVLIFTGR